VHPPQGDGYTYRDIRRKTTEKEICRNRERIHPLLVISRQLKFTLSILVQCASGNDQRNNGDKPQPDKEKPGSRPDKPQPDKEKLEPETQGDRVQQDPPKPKTKGLFSPLPSHELINGRLEAILPMIGLSRSAPTSGAL
jgi:hypothetical protein